MKTIVVPVDFSAASENAALYATDLAQTINAKIVLMHCVALPVTISEVPLPNGMLQEMTEEAEQNMITLRNRLIVRCDYKLFISTSVIMGYVMSELKDIVAEMDVFAVVMGSHGLGNSDVFMFGSTAVSAMHDLPCKVLLIPEHVSFRQLNRIGLCSDMIDVNRQLPFEGIKDVVGLFCAHLDILYVNTKGADMPGSVLSESKMLQDQLMDIHPDFHFVDNNSIDMAVTTFVKDNNIDMLMVIPKKHGFIGSIFHKSISKDIAQHLQLPILILH